MTLTAAAVIEEIKGQIEALRSAGAQGEATLFDSDLFVAGDDLRELLMLRESLDGCLCPASDCF
jgi:hypothetical protein